MILLVSVISRNYNTFSNIKTSSTSCHNPGCQIVRIICIYLRWDKAARARQGVSASVRWLAGSFWSDRRRGKPRSSLPAFPPSRNPPSTTATTPTPTHTGSSTNLNKLSARSLVWGYMSAIDVCFWSCTLSRGWLFGAYYQLDVILREFCRFISLRTEWVGRLTVGIIQTKYTLFQIRWVVPIMFVLLAFLA